MPIKSLTAAALVVTAILASACSDETLQPAPAAAALPEPAPWVVFQQDAGERLEIALVRTDGTDLTAPLRDLAGGNQMNPDWSPDGRRIVFAMSDGERDDLWVADADGSDARMLLDCRGRCRWLDDPDWSPDGRRIVYSRTIERADGWGIGTLETIDVATGRVRVVLGPWKRSFTAGARFSPGGDRVVFEKVHKTGRGPNADIDGVTLVVARIDAPRVIVRVITDPRLFGATADWSPDGKRIVYSALAEPDGAAPDLFWIRPRGGQPTRLTALSKDGGYAADPAWLPDNSGVLFSGRLDGVGSPILMTVGIDGSGLGSAFGDDVLFGTHPRVQPVP